MRSTVFGICPTDSVARHTSATVLHTSTRRAVAIGNNAGAERLVGPGLDRSVWAHGAPAHSTVHLACVIAPGHTNLDSPYYFLGAKVLYSQGTWKQWPHREVHLLEYEPGSSFDRRPENPTGTMILQVEMESSCQSRSPPFSRMGCRSGPADFRSRTLFGVPINRR